MSTKQLWTFAISLTAALAASEARADWYWVPSQITNAQTGDAILTSNQHGLIGTLLGSLGQFWSHTGMFIDHGYVIRHNTGDPNKLNTVGTPPERINSGDLFAMKPGIISQTVPEAFGDKGPAEFNLADQNSSNAIIDRNAVILKLDHPSGLGPSPYSGGLQMLKYEGMYSFYSYTDVWTTEPDGTDPDHLHVAPDLNRRNMCAGTVAWALFTGGGLAIWPYAYPAEMRDRAAPVLYNSIYNLVGTKVPGSGAGFLAGGSLGVLALSAITGNMRSKIANQIVNCMAFQDCNNVGDRWRGGVGPGNSIAPDNLLPVGHVNPRNVAWGMSGWNPQDPESIWYDTVEPVAYTGGYWKQY